MLWHSLFSNVNGPMGKIIKRWKFSKYLFHSLWEMNEGGLPWWLSGKESACQCRRCGFDPWVRMIPRQLFAWGGQSTGVSALASVLPKKSQGWSPSEWTGWIPLVGSWLSPRNSQKSSPTPQFKSINSSALSFLHSPTLTSIHDHRKNHSLD